MEKRYCRRHTDVVCVLKTGTTAGKSGYGRSFYMCQKMCGFYENAKIELAMKTCKQHGGLISIRRWTVDDCIQYKCSNKPPELGWCGTYSPKKEQKSGSCANSGQEARNVPERSSRLPVVEESSTLPVVEVGGGKSEESVADMSCEAISDVTEKLSNMSFESEGTAALAARKASGQSVEHVHGVDNPAPVQLDKSDLLHSGHLPQSNLLKEISHPALPEHAPPPGNCPRPHQKGDHPLVEANHHPSEKTANRSPELHQSHQSQSQAPHQPHKESWNAPHKESVSDSPSLAADEVSAQLPSAELRMQLHPKPHSQVKEPAVQPQTGFSPSSPPQPSPPTKLPDHLAKAPDVVHPQPPGATLSRPFVLNASDCLQERAGKSPEEKEAGKENEEKEEEKEVGAETFKVGYQSKKVIQQINEIDAMLTHMAHKLPDGGAALRASREKLVARLRQMKKPVNMAVLQQKQQQLPLDPTRKHGLAMQARVLTKNVVEHLHRSLEDCPVNDEMMEDPPGLTVSLMAHQSKALAWMTWRESQLPSGGILADDMGLGKTLTMLSLVTSGLNPPSDPGNKEWLKAPPAKQELLKCAGTLVVCPASLLMQWENEVKTKFEPGTMKTLIYHGGSRTKDPRVFCTYNVVITTYNIVGTEGTTVLEERAKEEEKIHPSAKGPEEEKTKKKRTTSFTSLFGIHWRRVILDEAHVIRNPRTAVAMGCCLITADSHWAVTGTPIQNKLQDMYSLVKFLQLAPFDDAMVWKSTVERRGTVGMRRLNTMVSALVLRRTKEEIGDMLHLTERVVETHNIRLRPDEEEIYRVLFQEARKLMYRWLEEQGEHCTRDSQGQDSATYLSSLSPDLSTVIEEILKPYVGCGSKGAPVLGLLLRLRQCCCHANLLTRVLKKEESDQDSLSLEIAMSTLSLEQKSDQMSNPNPEKFKISLPSVFKAEESSTKITEVIKELNRISSTAESPPQKSVVVSQWTSMLDIVQIHLKKAEISFSRIDGTVKPIDRQKRMNEFNSSKCDPMVMLLSLQAGGVGLNLIGGNHVFLLDLHWNPALEVQAADRCHRVGQPRDVHIHRFVCTGTVEGRIIQLQTKKLELAKNVLEGASNKMRKEKNKLSLNELKMLFEID